MKKILFLAVLLIMASTASAQLLTSTTITKQKAERKNHFAIEVGIGGITGDLDDGGLGVELGLRDTYMFTPNVGWDILKISAHTGTNHFTELLNLQAKTGIRGVRPILFGNATAYANFGCGYGYMTDFEKGGFAWEIGAGLNFTPNIALGAVYNSTRISGFDYGYVGGRVGFTF